MPLIYMDEVMREPYDGIIRDGTYPVMPLRLLAPIRCSERSVSTVLASGCCLSRTPSFGCETTTTSSRSTMRDESAAADVHSLLTLVVMDAVAGMHNAMTIIAEIKFLFIIFACYNFMGAKVMVFIFPCNPHLL